jgi:hypothetical protein
MLCALVCATATVLLVTATRAVQYIAVQYIVCYSSSHSKVHHMQYMLAWGAVDEKASSMCLTGSLCHLAASAKASCSAGMLMAQQ